MTKGVQKYNGGHSNNFDWVRLVLASSVLFLHFDHLASDAEISSLFGHLEFLSGRAVEMFFVVSGFVVYMSFDRRPNWRIYFLSRFFRLYPVYLTAVMLVGFWPLFVQDCYASANLLQEMVRYFGFNLIFLNFLQDTISCVFVENSDSALNGSLWTLKIEVMFYALTPVLYSMTVRYGAFRVFIMCYCGSVIYSAAVDVLAQASGFGYAEELKRQLPGQLTYFSVGILLYCFYTTAFRYYFLVLPVCFFVAFLQIYALEPLAIGYIVIWAATTRSFNLTTGPLGDISYGVYIFHFPVIQILISSNIFDGRPFLCLAASLCVTAFLSLASQRLIELPSRTLKDSLVRRLLLT